jgi:hypothetical protein
MSFLENCLKGSKFIRKQIVKARAFYSTTYKYLRLLEAEALAPPKRFS